MAGVGKVYGKVKPPQVFVDAVSKVMREWQAIKIAVDNMFGGPLSKEKAQWMEEVTVDFMCNNSNLMIMIVCVYNHFDYMSMYCKLF